MALFCALVFGLTGLLSYSRHGSVWTLTLTICAVLLWLVVAAFPEWRIWKGKPTASGPRAQD